MYSNSNTPGSPMEGFGRDYVPESFLFKLLTPKAIHLHITDLLVPSTLFVQNGLPSIPEGYYPSWGYREVPDKETGFEIICEACKGSFPFTGPCSKNGGIHGKELLCELYEILNTICTPRTTTGFRTIDSRDDNVFALDTEMVYTTDGMDAARVALVDYTGETRLDLYIKPSAEIINYNTRFSGISAADMEGAVSLETARNKLFEVINENTVLIGHHLANDLKALKIKHFKIVDTAVMFKRNGRFPSLRSLAETHLGKVIHDSENGHNPVEDANVCLEIVQKKWGFLVLNDGWKCSPRK